MTQAQFIAAVEAKPQFVKWAADPIKKEVIGDIEKWHGRAFITTPDGVNVFEVWFIVDTATGEANWQNQDTLEPEQNTDVKKLTALENYLKANFDAYFVVNTDLANNWAEAEVFKLTTGKLVRSNVMVFKKGANPISHLEIV